MATGEIEFYLSGGSNNTDPDLSLGGLKSSEQLFGQSVVYDSTAITGITLIDGSNLTVVELIFTQATLLLTIREVGDLNTTVDIDISVDGTYNLKNPDDSISLVVEVVVSSLPVGDETQLVNGSLIFNNLFNDVSKTDSEGGVISYRHFYIYNSGLTTKQIVLFLHSQLSGMDYLEIGFENTTENIIDQLLPSAASVPAGVIFNSPITALDGIMISLSNVGFVGVFIRRTVLALTDTSVDVDTAILEIAEYL